ncbi:MAG: flagellar L-ring protein precursor FlgH [Cellvibrionaceae bacterium]|jgi:flagellar L-ring protein precursor FlgH
MITAIKKIAIVCSLLVLAACQSAQIIKPDDPSFAPVVAPTIVKPKPITGSLFVPGYGVSLFGNTNAHRVGDIITVVLDERTVSSKSSTVGVDKDSSISLLENGAGTLLGKDLTKKIPLIGDITLPTSANHSRQFEGDASADQSNRLQGNISVTITDVMPNGNLVIRGEKWLKLNTGDEYIRISGMLRSLDVGLDNMVSSTKLANARIAYSGTGELADSQRQGWLGRFFNGPYWPL